MTISWPYNAIMVIGAAIAVNVYLWHLSRRQAKPKTFKAPNYPSELIGSRGGRL